MCIASAPKTPAPPPPPEKPAPAPTPVDENVVRGRSSARRRAATAGGRAATLLGGSLEGSAQNSTRKTLLGQ